MTRPSAIQALRKSPHVQALVHRIEAEAEIRLASATADEILTAFEKKLRRLEKADPEALNRAIAITIPRAKGNHALILYDPSAADIATELKRYADAGERSPLEALAERLVKL